MSTEEGKEMQTRKIERNDNVRNTCGDLRNSKVFLSEIMTVSKSKNTCR